MAKKPKVDKPEQKSFFKPIELRCKHTGEQNFDDAFLCTLNKIREECGFPFPISSGYRSPEHPIEKRKRRIGSHQTGKAVDILCSGERAIKLINVALANGITRIGIQQKGINRFIHIDACKVEDMGDNPNFSETAIWSY